VAEEAIDLRALRQATYPAALAALLELPGIGRKVADCILLFALDKWEAFPVDVWIRRAMCRLYARPLRSGVPPAAEGAAMSDREYRALAGFAWRRWGAVAGWAQEYLYCAARTGLL